MSNIQTNSNQSPFDSIRHVDSQGNEFWCARELMSLLGYPHWNRFTDAINRAKSSYIAQYGSNSVTEHFLTAMLKNEGKGRPKEDVKLSRLACYLTAMNGDPRKPEIAAAQSYFVIKTREAEVVIPQQSEELEILKLQNKMLSKQLELRHLDNTMLTLHGKQTVLVLRGYDQAIVEVETVVTEVVEPETKRSTKILSANQLKRLVKEKTGQNVPSLKWFTDQLRKHGRDDLLTPVTRHVTGEYPVPERINEAIEIVFEKNRQMLLGE